MNEALKNISRTPEPEKRICTVIGRAFFGIWNVQDGSGRTYRVDSDAFWRPGDTVIIQLGRIVGRATRMPTKKIYEV